MDPLAVLAYRAEQPHWNWNTSLNTQQKHLWLTVPALSPSDTASLPATAICILHNYLNSAKDKEKCTVIVTQHWDFRFKFIKSMFWHSPSYI